jgi:hypothetical protein
MEIMAAATPGMGDDDDDLALYDTYVFAASDSFMCRKR